MDYVVYTAPPVTHYMGTTDAFLVMPLMALVLLSHALKMSTVETVDYILLVSFYEID